jgi:phosphoglucosamine mutase
MPILETAHVRSTHEQAMTPEIAMRIGQAVGLQYKDVTVGIDVNLSSEMLCKALISGLLSAGAKVRYAGVAPASAVAFSSTRSKCFLMVSDSDSFGVNSGITLRLSDGAAFNTEQIRQVRNTFNSESIDLPIYRSVGDVVPVDGVIEKYRRKVTSILGETDCPVILDCGCGVTSLVAPQLFTDMHSDLMAINCQVDGRYPARSPSLEESELRVLSDNVKANLGNIGIALNGDGTKMALIDEIGRYISPDRILALLVHYLEPKSIVVPMNTSAIIDDIFNGTIRKTSDVAVCDVMKGNDIRFGARANGSFIFSDVSYCADGIFASACIAKLAAENSIRDIVDNFPEYVMDRTRIVFDGSNKDVFKKKLAEELEALEHNSLVESQGWRLEMDSGWFLVWIDDGPYVDITAEGKDKAYLVGLLEIAKDAVMRAMHVNL